MIHELIGFHGPLHVVDIGAAAIAEMPPYKALLDGGLARLTAVDGDERHIAGIKAAFGAGTTILPLVIGDGERRNLYLASAQSGMSSLLKPAAEQLAFFNGFSNFGNIERVVEVQTHRMADVEELQSIDFLKMDVQGAELMILENAGEALDRCVAIHLEASFVTLYEGQPSIGEIDLWMRRNGYQPHLFADLKRWSIAPSIRDGDFRKPFNQLLECDIVYVRGLVDLRDLDDEQVMNILLIASHCYDSPDLAFHAALELERRAVVSPPQMRELMTLLAKPCR